MAQPTAFRPELGDKRPGSHIAVLGFEELIAATAGQRLIDSIEQRMRLSQSNYLRDVVPVLHAFAEYVQMLPASEAHHHAQPGGLLTHALEVVDYALRLRTGLELPPDASTEDRKRAQHRWTYAVFVAALLHDAGKPISDVRVTLFNTDPRAGRIWAPLAGPMTETSATHYLVEFAAPVVRDYTLHQRLPALLLHRFVPAHALRWIGDDHRLIAELAAYLVGEARNGPLGSIVSRADSESVRRNLASGPRTRFATARVRPLIERLMEAMRRMLLQGGLLPLNRPGAAGWVAQGAVWFACARLADEVREYLATHESAEGVPGKDKNDRLFDTWQEFGAVEASPEGGAVWRVLLQIDDWITEEPLTVLRFPLARLYAREEDYPRAVSGLLIPIVRGVGPDGRTLDDVRAELRQRAKSLPAAPGRGVPAGAFPDSADSTTAAQREPDRDPDAHSAQRPETGQAVAAKGALNAAPPLPPSFSAVSPSVLCADQRAFSEDSLDARIDRLVAKQLAAEASETVPGVASDATAGASELLAPTEVARVEPQRVIDNPEPAPSRPVMPRPSSTLRVGSREANKEVANIFLRWLQKGVQIGDLRYNDSNSLVHFVPEGCLLLTPEIFKRFVREHETVTDGELGAAVAEGDRAFKRVQRALAVSGWIRRNGKENVHYYASTRTQGGRGRTMVFFLLPEPAKLWNPVPTPNERLIAVAKGSGSGSSSTSTATARA